MVTFCSGLLALHMADKLTGRVSESRVWWGAKKDKIAGALPESFLSLHQGPSSLPDKNIRFCQRWEPSTRTHRWVNHFEKVLLLKNTELRSVLSMGVLLLPVTIRVDKPAVHILLRMFFQIALEV